MKHDVFEIYAKRIDKGEMSIVNKQNSCQGTVKGKIQNNAVITASQYTQKNTSNKKKKNTIRNTETPNSGNGTQETQNHITVIMNDEVKN